MEYIDIENKLYQIISSTYYIKYNMEEYKSVPNTIDDKNRASILYQEIMDDIKYDNMISWEQAKIISKRLNIWTDENENSLKSLSNMLDNLKLELFLSHYDPTKVKKLKKQITSLKKGLEKSNDNKYTLYAHTKEYYASNIKRDFLIGLSVRDKNDNKIILPEDFWLCNNPIIEMFNNKINRSFISVSDIREIARSEPWRSMWLSQKGECLGNRSVEWTETQRLLMSFSRMYDNVYESMDCPPDEVISDDDMLDGWFIKQSRERKEKQKEKSLEDKFGKFKDKDGQELFIAARPEDVQDIYNMNDAKGRGVIKSRNKQIEQQKEVKHAHLKDVQMDLHMQKTQEMRETMRRR